MVSFDFKDKSLLGAGSSGGIEIQPEADVLAALASGGAFPSRRIELAEGSLKAQGNKDITFGPDGHGNGQVTFGANISSQLVVNGDPAQLVESLSLAEPLADGLTFATGAAISYAGLLWSYGISAGATGAMGLGGGVKVTGSASAQQSGAFALIHQFSRTEPAGNVLQALIDSWRLPSQLGSVDDLRPGTWMVAEIDGNLALSLKATYGYDFNWIRHVGAGKISGDIGLHLQAGINAALGFTASGRYALVVSRESTDPAQRRLRVRLFKQPVRGMSFALHAGVTAKADTSAVTPATLDELLRAVLNVQDQQILADIGSWLDPSKSLEEILSADLVDRFKVFLNEVTGVSVATKIDEARAKLSGLLKQWDSLDQRVAATLWKQIADQDFVVAVRGLAMKVDDLLGNDDAGLRQLLLGEIEKQGFFQSPEGQWLAAQATDGLLDLIQDNKQLAKLREVSKQTLDILSEQELNQLTSRLQDALAKRFGLDKVKNQLEQALDASDPQKLDAWLRDRLTTFLGKIPVVKDLDDIRKTIDAWRSRAGDFYAKAVQALQKQYGADLAFTYQKTTTRTALIDVELDFAAGDGSIAQLLRDTLDGRFDRLLNEAVPGAMLRQATLTHQIQRSKQLDLTLPSTFAEMKSTNQGLASVTATEDGGRVLLYEGEGTDEVSFATAKTRRDSRLSVVAQLPVPVAGLRQFQGGTLSFSYSYQQATQMMQKDRVANLLTPYAHLFLPDSEATFAIWLDELDAAAKAREPQGAKILGNTLISLEVNVPPAVGNAWLNAPPAGDPKYRAMSLRIQRRFKEVLVLSYFGSDVSHYGDPDAEFLLAWAAIPPFNKPGGLYWNHPKGETVRSMVNKTEADTYLQSFAQRAKALLGRVGRNDIAQTYSNPVRFSKQVRENAFIANQPQPQPQLQSLLSVESRLIDNAAKTGAAIHKVLKDAQDRPQKAIMALAKYTANLAATFNDVWSLYGKGAVRPLGTILFQEAAMAFDDDVEIDTSALLRLTVLRNSVTPFPPADFPQNVPIPAEQVLVDETLVNA